MVSKGGRCEEEEEQQQQKSECYTSRFAPLIGMLFCSRVSFANVQSSVPAPSDLTSNLNFQNKNPNFISLLGTMEYVGSYRS